MNVSDVWQCVDMYGLVPGVVLVCLVMWCQLSGEVVCSHGNTIMFMLIGRDS